MKISSRRTEAIICGNTNNDRQSILLDLFNVLQKNCKYLKPFLESSGMHVSWPLANSARWKSAQTAKEGGWNFSSYPGPSHYSNTTEQGRNLHLGVIESQCAVYTVECGVLE